MKDEQSVYNLIKEDWSGKIGEEDGKKRSKTLY